MITGIEDRGWAGMLVGLAAACAATGPGLRVLRWLRRPPDLVIALALGSGAVAQSVIALGWCGLALPAMGWLLLALAAGSVLGGRPRRAARALGREVRARWRESRWMCGIAMALGMATLAAVTMPPLIYDVVAYHLLLPQQYALQHRAFAMPHFMPSAFPHLSTGGALWMFLLEGGWRAAGALNWVWLPVGALAAGRVAAAVGGAGAAGVLGLCLVPMTLIAASTPLADLPGAALALLAVSAAAVRSSGRWPLAGLLCGLAAATKYNAGAAAFVGCAALLPFRRGPAIALAVAGSLPLVPLLSSNLLNFAAPFFPLFTAAPQARRVAEWNRELATAPRTFLGAVTWPVRLIWDAPSYLRKELVQVGAGLAGLVAVVVLPRGGLAWRLAVAGWVVWLVAFFGCWPLRYLLPVTGFAVAVSCAAVARVRAGPALLVAALAVCAVPHAAAWARLPVVWLRAGVDAGRWLDGFRWPWPPGPVTRFLRDGLPAGAVVAPVFETQLFWAGRAQVPSLMHDRSVVFAGAAAARSAEGLVERLRRRGITHVLFAHNLDPVAAPQWLSWGTDREHAFVRALASDVRRVVYEDETHRVLSLGRLTGSPALR